MFRLGAQSVPAMEASLAAQASGLSVRNRLATGIVATVSGPPGYVTPSFTPFGMSANQHCASDICSPHPAVVVVVVGAAVVVVVVGPSSLHPYRWFFPSFPSQLSSPQVDGSVNLITKIQVSAPLFGSLGAHFLKSIGEPSVQVPSSSFEPSQSGLLSGGWAYVGGPTESSSLEIAPPMNSKYAVFSSSEWMLGKWPPRLTQSASASSHDAILGFNEMNVAPPITVLFKVVVVVVGAPLQSLNW